MTVGLILDSLYLLVLAVSSPILWLTRFRKGKKIADWRARLFGLIPRRGRTQRCVWFHGVSVGEIHMLAKVIEAFRKRFRDFEIVVSSTTPAGLTAARRLFPNDRVIVWPFDFTWAVKRAIHRIAPDLIVLAESELWPNFLRCARQQGVLVAVINGRMSPKSARRYRCFGWLLRSSFAGVRLWAMQTQEHAATVRQLTSAAVAVTGNVKYDGVLVDRNNEATRAFRSLFQLGEDPVWVAGSTQAPEEEIVLVAFRILRTRYPRLRLVVVPRQPGRFEEVAQLLERAEFVTVRRSRLTCQPESPPDIVLVDSLGELSAIWGLADIAFVGGSLDGKRGGQNMIEPAAFGAALLFGPHTWNFRATVQMLLSHEAAIEVRDADELTKAVDRLLASSSLRVELGQRARRLVLEQQGAADRTVSLLAGLLRHSEGKLAA